MSQSITLYLNFLFLFDRKKILNELRKKKYLFAIQYNNQNNAHPKNGVHIDRPVKRGDATKNME